MANFDEVINRRNTNSLKWDFYKERGHSDSELPMWVADMDFKLPDNIINPIIDKVKEGIFGYSDPKDDLFDSIINWQFRHNGLKINKEDIIINPSVVFSICTLINILTNEGDSILINEPVYYPFKSSIIDNNRKAINSNLIMDNNKYVFDFIDFEQKIKDYNVKLFILCNPHNPVGRVWSEEELNKIINICLKNSVYIISDEIHSDFCYHKRFNSALLFNDKVIVVTAPTKTFNIPGLKISYTIIKDPLIRTKYYKELDKVGYSQQSIIGMVATKAAYNNGDLWLKELKDYIWDNILHIKEYLDKYLPKIKFIIPEGTYLVWLDFNRYNLSASELKELIKKANLWFDDGIIFGRSGSGFERINVATTRYNIDIMLNSLYKVFKDL